MTDLYPLLLLPEFHERVWGAHDLSAYYPSHKVGKEPIGEAWLTGEQCKVANGPLVGRTLDQLAKQFGVEMNGTVAIVRDRFPLLMKILFPRERLSVQVHPDDATAQRIGQPCGKTECWYVLEASPGAQIGLGLRPGTTPAAVEASIHNKNMEQLLNWIDVAPGDMYYVDAGTVHAIGPGSVLLETQQNSDTTYRLYDYGRPRELHIRQGLEAMKERTHAGKVKSAGANGRIVLVSSPSFQVDKIFLKQEKGFVTMESGRSSPHCLVGIQGCGVVEAEGAQPVSFGKGESVVVPAGVKNYRVRPQWQFEYVRAMLPGANVAEPNAIPAHELQAVRQ
ncbi:MAG TPA: type I phosphomannose isomerase catalytic subunit [Terriglobales bacterium]